MDNIDEIKARIDVVDLVSESVQLKRSGKNYMGFCPFHENTRTPAFAVFPESGTWRCFGQCNDGGDIFKFVMKKEGWDFVEALRHLADRAGIQLRTPSPQEQEQEEKNERIRELLEDAVTFFRHQLLNTPEGQTALVYLRDRGLEDETIEIWGLGYAPNSWDATHTYFRSKGYTEDELIEGGLVSERETGGVYDRFRHRLTFPIRDERGRMTGFGARVLDPEDVPKYLNTPQTTLFDKSGLLYGLDKARKPIRTEDQVVIVEGYIDVIALHQHGHRNAVSPMGTALTEHQLRLIKRRTRRIILALDADAAGQQATLRGLQIAREAMDRKKEISFDARGLLRQEARLQADIRVTTLPAGKDPDDVLRENPENWVKILEGAKPVVIHVMETLASERDLDDPKVKIEIADQILPLIADLPNSIERETYRQRLARLLRVDERALMRQVSQPPHGRRSYQRGSSRRSPLDTPEKDDHLHLPPTAASTHRREAYTLGVLLRHPHLIFRVDRALQQAGLTRLSPDDFQYTDHQVMMNLILNSIDQDFDEPTQVAVGSLPLSLMDLADQALAQTEKLAPNELHMLEDLMQALLDLRRRRVNQNIDHLRFLMEDAQEQGELIVNQYQESMLQHATALSRLDRALAQCADRSLLIK